MKGKYLGSYISKNGNPVFKYAVSGTPEQLEEFKKAQGDNAREDEQGNPLWFTTRFAGKNATLAVAKNSGRVYADTSDIRAVASLADQFSGKLGDALASRGADMILGSMFKGISVAAAPVAEEKPLDESAK